MIRIRQNRSSKATYIVERDTLIKGLLFFGYVRDDAMSTYQTTFNVTKNGEPVIYNILGNYQPNIAPNGNILNIDISLKKGDLLTILVQTIHGSIYRYGSFISFSFTLILLEHDDIFITTEH
jgi:Na+-translocating ferredoxin:NAD+ oxidoreductase RnfA subunit